MKLERNKIPERIEKIVDLIFFVCLSVVEVDSSFLIHSMRQVKKRKNRKSWKK